MSPSLGVTIPIPTTFISLWINTCVNHTIKASNRVFIKLTKCFQTRMSFKPPCLAQAFKFVVASIGAILLDSKLQELLPLKRIVKKFYLLSYYLTDKSHIRHTILNVWLFKNHKFAVPVIMSTNDLLHLKMKNPY